MEQEKELPHYYVTLQSPRSGLLYKSLIDFDKGIGRFLIGSEVLRRRIHIPSSSPDWIRTYISDDKYRYRLYVFCLETSRFIPDLEYSPHDLKLGGVSFLKLSEGWVLKLGTGRIYTLADLGVVGPVEKLDRILIRTRVADAEAIH